MIIRSSITTLLLFLPSAAAFQGVSPPLAHKSARGELSFSSVVQEDATATTTEDPIIPVLEAQTLFGALADSTLSIDPSGGTCCRGWCSSCQYMVVDGENGDWVFDEHFSPEGVDVMWLAPYAISTAKPETVISKWGEIFFRKEDKMKRDDFEGLIVEALQSTGKKTVLTEQNNGSDNDADSTAIIIETDAATLVPSASAIDALWAILSPVPGSPVLSRADISRALKGLEGNDLSKGGAVTCVAFEAALQKAASKASADGGNNIFIDYEAMEKAELKKIVNERKMVRVPGMKKYMIEELRFFDANGRQGKRHPVKNSLS